MHCTPVLISAVISLCAISAAAQPVDPNVARSVAATCANCNGTIDVTVVEPNPEFISCAMSNLVIGGSQDLAFLTTSYANLTARHGVKIIRDTATAVDVDKRVVKLTGANELAYDRLILSPGV